MQRLFIITLFLLSSVANSQSAFQILPLGVGGGVVDGDLSAYLVKSINSENYISLDGGSLISGLKVAADKQALGNNSIQDLVQNHIPAYLISHAHLDHIVGLLIAQPELQQQQQIMAQKDTMQALQKYIFNWSVWGNFGNSGEKPHLDYQKYQTLPLLQWHEVDKTDLKIKVFPLKHGSMASSAFLIRNKNEYILYFGDTGADNVEQATNLSDIWNEIAPLIRNKQLHAIMLECSFTNAQADDKLFGHLNPHLFMTELRKLATRVNPSDTTNAIKGLPVIVTHIKPSLDDFSYADKDTGDQIMRELSEANDVGVFLIKPEQGRMLSL